MKKRQDILHLLEEKGMAYGLTEHAPLFDMEDLAKAELPYLHLVPVFLENEIYQLSIVVFP